MTLFWGNSRAGLPGSSSTANEALARRVAAYLVEAQSSNQEKGAEPSNRDAQLQLVSPS